MLCSVGFCSYFQTDFSFFILHLSQPGSFAPPLSAAQEREALAKMHAGDKSARSELIEHNLRLVAHIVKKYYAAYSDQDDLISIGTVGLIKAIDSFKPDKGTRLATYAAKCVENAILSQRNNRRLKWKTMNLLGQNGLCSAA